MLRRTTGSTSAEDFASARLTSSLEHGILNAPMPILKLSVEPMLHFFLHLIFRGAQSCTNARVSDLPTTIGCTDAHSIGASDGCRKIRRPGFGTSLCASRDQVKKEVQHRMNRRRQPRHRCIGCTMFQRRCQARRSQAFSTG